MSGNKTKKVLEKAQNYFFRGEYDEAMRIYGLLLKDHPHLSEAKIGAILTDIAKENDEEGQALFEYYQVLKDSDEEDAEAIIASMIETFDGTVDKLSELIEGVMQMNEEPSEGIAYRDFLELVETRGDFARAFEDVMFSTRVVITEKEDLLDFIERLIANGFEEMASRYIENAVVAFPGEKRVEELVAQLKGDG